LAIFTQLNHYLTLLFCIGLILLTIFGDTCISWWYNATVPNISFIPLPVIMQNLYHCQIYYNYFIRIEWRQTRLLIVCWLNLFCLLVFYFHSRSQQVSLICRQVNLKCKIYIFMIFFGGIFNHIITIHVFIIFSIIFFNSCSS